MKSNNSITIYNGNTFYFKFAFLILLITVTLVSCDNKSSESDKPQVNREINTSEFDNANSNANNSTNTNPTSNSSETTVPVDPITQDSLDLVSQGFEATYVRNGNEPDCFNYSPQKNNEIDNELIVNVGGGTDVAIKIMSYRSGRCIRYFFVNSSSTYTVKNIPEGKYYLKIAYGKQWMMSNDIGQCKGKFLRSAKYEKGDDVLDFNIRAVGNSREVPSYELSLDVISTNVMSSFESKNISESEFND